MWAAFYAKRVSRDLDDWIAKGWVTNDNAAAIRASLDPGETTSRLPIVLTVLGAVLIGFAAMAFVGANWDDMSKALRLGLLALAMLGAYGTAAFLHLRQHPGFAEAALLIGVGLYGASIMLIGQMYHLPSDFSAGLLAWSLGALVTAWAVQSRAALAAAQLLLMGWTGAEFTGGSLHLTYLLPWAALAFLAIRLNWTPGKHLALIGFIFWLLGNAPSFAEKVGWGDIELISVLSSLFVLLWLTGLSAEQKVKPFSRALQAYSALALLILFWIGQVADESVKTDIAMGGPVTGILLVLTGAYATSRRVHQITLADVAAFAAFPLGVMLTGALNDLPGEIALWGSAPVLLLLCVWMVALGTRLHNRFLINLGFAGFGGEALYLYFETFGTLLDTAVFFAIGGALLIAGGLVWERLRRRITTAQTKVTP